MATTTRKQSTKRPVKTGAAGAASKKADKARKAAPAAKPRPATKPKPSNAEPERSAPPLAEVDAEVLEFIAAIDAFKKQHGRPFPSWSEVLLVVRQLGYTRR